MGLSRAGNTACSAVGASLPAEAEATCGGAAIVDLAAAQACDGLVHRCLDAVRDLDVSLGDKLMELWPGMGAYPNEASFYQKDWKTEFWGSSYAKLEDIKREVDPGNMFQCHHCVGSD